MTLGDAVCEIIRKEYSWANKEQAAQVGAKVVDFLFRQGIDPDKEAAF